MINKILIRTSDRKTLHKDRRSLGMNGENLQEVLLFCLDEKIEGNGIVEVELPDGTKGMIEVDRTEEGYELPVKSSLLTQTGFVKFQLRILHDNEEIFKSEIIALEVKDSINATETIPEQYLTWIDTLTNLKQDLEKSESERVSNENERISAEEARQENFTEMQETISSAVSNIKNLTEEYNTNAEKETKKFNDNAVEQTKTFNDNSDSRLAEYDKNHNDKMKEYDGNAIAKLDAYNENDTDKTNAYNANDITKTKAYNDNTVLKEKAYNDNAADKVKEYNTNVEQKETELEKLAEKKINEYNQVSAELTAKVEQVQAENKLIKEQIPSASVSGNNIHIEDSGTLDFDWKIKGGHKQKTREGYQLLNLQNGTQNGITYYVDSEGYFYISGTCTSDRITLNLNEIVLNGTYTFTNKSISGGEINCVLKDNTPEYGNIFTKNNETKEVNTVLKDLVCYLTNGATYNSKIKLMLVSGSQEKDIELYGASPSPDYSSEIETVGSNVNILENKAITQTINGVTFTVNKDGSIMVNGIATTNTTFKINNNIIPKNISNLILSGCPNNGSTDTYDLKIELYKNGVWTKALYDFGNGVNTGDLSEYTSCKISATIRKDYNANNLIFKPKLEKGTVETPYSPYGMGSVGINVVNKNLFIEYTKESIYSFGITFNANKNILNFNGSVTSENYPSFTFYKNGSIVANQYWATNKAIKKERGFFDANTINKILSFISSGTLSTSRNQKFRVDIGYETQLKSFNIYEFKNNMTFLSDVQERINFISFGFTPETTVSLQVKIQLEVGDTATTYVEHQSQTAIMPIQQEMLTGDYIKDVEHHEWKKVVLDGTENWREITTNNLKRFFYEVNVASINDNNSVNCSSNYFKGTSRNKLEHSSGDEVSVADRFLNILSKKIETKEDFKAWLKSKYDEGNPVVVYYKLATPLNLELTEGQKAIRDTKLYTYKNITNIDVSDELASIDVEYKKDLDLEHEKLQNQIDEIRQLISTTETSALLLDNLQKDAESEVK